MKGELLSLWVFWQSCVLQVSVPEMFPDAAKMKKQMSYANAKSIPFVAIVGENEMNEGKAMLKNMETRRTESCFGGRTDSCFTQLKAGYRVQNIRFSGEVLDK